LAISRARKEELLEQYKQMLGESRGIFLAEYKGIDVKKMEALRANVRDASGTFSVTKNTLFALALEESGFPVPAELLTGQIATGFATGEVPTMAKTLIDFAKDEDNFVVKGGVVGGKVLSAAEVEALAKLPNLEQLRAQIAGLVSAPARNIAGTVASGVRQLVNVVDAYARSADNDQPAEAAA
jgi:large subunit ribosomal protein L10